MCMTVVYGFGLSHLSVHEQKNVKASFKSTLKHFSCENPWISQCRDQEPHAGTRSHMQDVLQEPPRKLSREQCWEPELLWHQFMQGSERSGKRLYDMLPVPEKWTQWSGGVCVPEWLYQAQVYDQINRPFMVLTKQTACVCTLIISMGNSFGFQGLLKCMKLSKGVTAVFTGVLQGLRSKPELMQSGPWAHIEIGSSTASTCSHSCHATCATGEVKAPLTQAK